MISRSSLRQAQNKFLNKAILGDYLIGDIVNQNNSHPNFNNMITPVVETGNVRDDLNDLDGDVPLEEDDPTCLIICLTAKEK